MWPDCVSNPGPLTYESGALPTALRGPALSQRAPTHPHHHHQKKKNKERGEKKKTEPQQITSVPQTLHLMCLHLVTKRPLYYQKNSHRKQQISLTNGKQSTFTDKCCNVLRNKYVIRVKNYLFCGLQVLATWYEKE